jgi:hypothetical protein
MEKSAEDVSGGQAPRVPVSEVLTTLSGEVRVLADGVGDLQDLIGNLLVAGAFSGSSSLYGLQCLDRLSQNLEAIADFLVGVGKQSSPDWKIDIAEASRAVKLADMSDRLNGVAGEGAGAPDANAGDFEDFEGWSLTG